MSIEILANTATATSVVITILGILLSVFSKKETKTIIKQESIHIDNRITEAKDKLKSIERYITFNQRANNMIIVGQYIVGAVLASSFIQESLSTNIIGLLGLIVLISSTAQQHYKPAQKVIAGKKRSSLLKSKIREIEDDLVELRLQNNGKMTNEIRILEQPLIKRISEELSDIDDLENKDYQNLEHKVVQTK